MSINTHFSAQIVCTGFSYSKNIIPSLMTFVNYLDSEIMTKKKKNATGFLCNMTVFLNSFCVFPQILSKNSPTRAPQFHHKNIFIHKFSPVFVHFVYVSRQRKK